MQFFKLFLITHPTPSYILVGLLFTIFHCTRCPFFEEFFLFIRPVIFYTSSLSLSTSIRQICSFPLILWRPILPPPPQLFFSSWLLLLPSQVIPHTDQCIIPRSRYHTSIEGLDFLYTSIDVLRHSLDRGIIPHLMECLPWLRETDSRSIEVVMF